MAAPTGYLKTNTPSRQTRGRAGGNPCPGSTMPKDKYGFPKGSHRAALMAKYPLSGIPGKPGITAYRAAKIANLLQGPPGHNQLTTYQLANHLGLQWQNTNQRRRKVWRAICYHNQTHTWGQYITAIRHTGKQGNLWQIQTWD